MLGVPEFDRDVEGGHRKYAAPLHSRSGRGPRHLISQPARRTPNSGPVVLALDAAGSACAAAVAAGARLVAVRHATMMRGQAEALLPMVNDVVSEAGLTPSALELIAVTTGPGSFTGIRVGIAAARGIALACGCPLFGISSFEAVAEAVPRNALAGRSLLVALESRRADLYFQLFDSAQGPLSEPAAGLPETLGTTVAGVSGHGIVIAGDAAARAAEVLARQFDVTILDTAPPVTGALYAALRRWRRGPAAGAVRPLYLRPPDVTLAPRQPPLGH